MSDTPETNELRDLFDAAGDAAGVAGCEARLAV